MQALRNRTSWGAATLTIDGPEGMWTHTSLAAIKFPLSGEMREPKAALGHTGPTKVVRRRELPAKGTHQTIIC